MQSLYCSHGHENPPSNRFCSQCGEKLDLPVTVQPQPSRYRIIRELGQGGFGRTYLAEDLNRFNEPCVLKEFAPQVQDVYTLQKAAELFEREAGVLYQLQHPQIPKFRELFRVKLQNQARLFLVQDFVVGETYRTLLEQRQQQGLKFTETEVTELLRKILPVLAYIHSLGVVHRDISPDNLISRNPDGMPVLIDFGAVKQVAATVVSEFKGASMAIATRLGKVGYAPHEQLQSGIVYPNSDLYALAATALTLLTAKEPQQLINSRTLTWHWQTEVTLSPNLNRVLDKMLQPVPDARYQTASEVLEALRTPPSLVAVSPLQPFPLPLPEATVALAPAQISPPSPAPASPGTGTLSASTDQSGGYFGKLMLLPLLIIGAGAFGWWAGNLWIKSQIQPQSDNQDFSNPVFPSNQNLEMTPSAEFSALEQERKQKLREHRINLGIDYNFYVDLVNQEFWQQYPNQRGQQLSNDSGDALKREEWDTIAQELLSQIEELNLSGAARQQLGKYGQADRDRTKTEANTLNVSSRAVYDLADAKFLQHFPQQQGEDFLNQPIGQLWHAIVSDTVKALKSGEGLQRLVFDRGASSKQLSRMLQPGEGKIYIAKLSQEQVMDVKLSANEDVLFSIYSPSGDNTLLEDSRDRNWSGSLPESGYYEFVLVSHATAPVDYQLDLTVEDN